MPTGAAASRLDAAYRAAAWDRLAAAPFDVLVIGGGVTGAGAALDAATRGLSVALVEARDFASGTSSRSSKLFHGGLRYLEQLEFGLVREALRERELMLTRLAPHLVRPVPFLYPLTHRAWERAYVASGLALYDSIGGRSQPARAEAPLSRRAALRMFPSLRPDALTGAVRYFDAQTDDARHTLTVARTAARYGAVARSSTQVIGLVRESDRVVGVRVRDTEDGREAVVQAGVVLNCTGVWTDEIQAMSGARGRFQVRASKGIHIVVPREKITGDAGPDPAHSDVGAVRDPVEDPLADRHDRHRLDARSRASGGDSHRHRLPARAGQRHAGHTARPRGHPGRVRRAAPPARRGVRGDLVAVARACCRARRSRPDLDRRREVHHLPGDGARRRGRRSRRSAEADPPSCTDRVPLLGADGYFAVRNQVDSLAAEYGLHPHRMRHVLDRYGSLIRDVLEPGLGRARTARDRAGGAGLPDGRDPLRRHARGGAAPRGRADAAHPDLDRVPAPRCRPAPTRWRRRWGTCSAGIGGAAAAEVDAYAARVEAERASQDRFDDEAGRRGAHRSPRGARAPVTRIESVLRRRSSWRPRRPARASRPC